RKSTIFDRSEASGSPVRAGVRSASKRTIRVHETFLVRPSGASSTMTKRSRSWSRERSRDVNSGRASRQTAFRRSRRLWPPSRACSIETTGSRNIRVCGISCGPPVGSSDRQTRVAKDLARDDQTVDLARPLVDLRDPRIAKVSFDGILLGVPVAAVDLQ